MQLMCSKRSSTWFVMPFDPTDSTRERQAEKLPAFAEAPERAVASKVAFLFVMACPFVAFVLLGRPAMLWSIALAVSLAVVFAFARRGSDLTAHGAFWAFLLAALTLQVPWPLSFVLPFVLLFVAARRFATFRAATTWLRMGALDRSTLWLMIPIILGSSAGLVGWFVFFSVDISATTQMIPPITPAAFAVGAVAFSMLNATWEEFLLKGMMWSGLSRVFPEGLGVNVIQSFFFGLVHYHGFPHGVTGVIMTSVYGFAIGLVRQRSNGMLAPIVTHVFADMTICALVFARWRGLL